MTDIRPRFILSSLLLALISLAAFPPLPSRQHALCVRTDPLRLTEKCIGPLPVRAPISQLKAIQADSKDSVHYGENDSYPGIVFHFVGLTAAGWQYNDSLQPNSPVDTWVVTGARAMLPEGVPITAEWTQLRGQYGRGIVDTEDGIRVMFCRFPSLVFELSFDSARKLDGLGRIDMSRIPPGARIASITIAVEPAAGWNC